MLNDQHSVCHVSFFLQARAAAVAPAIAGSNIKKAMLIGMTYSSTIGGMCTVVGTPTNMIALGIYSATYVRSNRRFYNTNICFRINLQMGFVSGTKKII